MFKMATAMWGLKGAVLEICSTVQLLKFKYQWRMSLIWSNKLLNNRTNITACVSVKQSSSFSSKKKIICLNLMPCYYAVCPIIQNCPTGELKMTLPFKYYRTINTCRPGWKTQRRKVEKTHCGWARTWRRA